MRSRNVFPYVLALVIGSTVFAQQPHWYVLLEPGNERWYRSPSPAEFHELVTGYQDGASVVVFEYYYNDELLESRIEYWRIDEGGDVWNGDTCYIDMPLELGKTWGTTWGEWGQYYDTFTIVDFVDQYAPNCVVICEDYNGYGIHVVFHRWYSDGIGLVHIQSDSCWDCHWSLEPLVVNVEARTWSSLKSLFRN